MDKDRQAVKLSIEAICKDAILDIFGSADEDASIHKLHTALELADKLRIQEGTVTISFKELRASKKAYLTEVVNKDE
jgi:hypothetical protein